MTNDFYHKTVLLHEAVDRLEVKPNGVYVDATLGGAGHSSYLLSQLNSRGRLYAFDQDQKAIDQAKIRLQSYIEAGQAFLIKDNFKHLSSSLSKYGQTAVDGVLYDLGVSSPQLDEGERGFSYKKDAPLDMRMNQAQELSAYEVINHYAYRDLVRIFFHYGEDKFAKQVARKIEAARQTQPIATTGELAELIKAAKPAKELKKKGHPAKQIFQAIRIEVNDELKAVRTSLEQALALLKPEGRIAVISFHSLEDRIVKQLFREVTELSAPKGLPFIPEELQPKFELINRRPILPSKEELEVNHRAHSAKLRVIKKIRE